MTIGTRTAGAWASGSTSLVPALPASPAAGDMMIMFVGAKPYTATIVQPSGWTRIGTQQTNGTTASGIDTGSVTWSVFYRAWQSGDAAPTVSVTSGNVALACINGFTKTAGAWVTPAAYFGSDTTSGTGYSITAASSSGAIASGDYLLHGTVIAGNNATFGTPTLSATSATIGTVTESPATEGTTATGNDLEASAAFAAVTAGTSSSDAVCGWTLSVAQTGGSALVRLREDSTQTLTPSVVSDGDTFHAATVTPGAVSLTPSLYENTATFHAPEVSAAGADQTLTQAARFDGAQIVYGPTATPGAVTLTAAMAENTSAVHAPTVTAGTATLAPARFDHAAAFYAATVTSGAVTLAPGRLDNSAGFPVATVTPGTVSLAASLADNAPVFYTHTISAAAGAQTLAQGARFDGAQGWFVPLVTPGSVTVSPPAVGSAQAFFGSVVAVGGVQLEQVSRLDGQVSFYVAVVEAAVAVPAADRFDYDQLLRDPVLAPPMLQRMAAHQWLVRQAQRRRRP